MDPLKKNESLKRIAGAVCKKRYIPRLREPREAVRPLDDESACTLFKGYFNNKMTTFLLLVQRQRPEPDSLLSMKAVIFFDDLYHHMLRARFQKDYHRVFAWLKLFFKRFPYVKPVQKRKAIEYLGLVYRLFGLSLKINI